MTNNKQQITINDDIPEALRDRFPSQQPRRQLSASYLTVALGLFVPIGLMAFVFSRFLLPSPPSSSVASPPLASKTANPSPEPIDNILGHLPYAVAPASQLKAITADGGLRLRQQAADKFLQMRADAAVSGVILTPLSAFRSISEQEYLFFKVKEQRNQAASQRAEVSAPPGHSEHHTGYAIDIGDGKRPETNLSTSFEQTAAFRWLQANANRYSFELSFPRNNPQGISYEPWHWRYVGDRDSLETFYKAKKLKQK